MGKKVKEYKSGDFIFAKVKGYPAWPARVQKHNGKKYFVYFYGTGETANLPPNMIFDYEENKEKFLNKSIKRKDFNEGVRQIEHDFANNVPLEQVIGLLEAPADGANDTANDTGNDTMDDSAVDTTTADDTVADTTATTQNATQNDTAVEDSDETGALVIDEGKAPAKPARKSKAAPAAAPEPPKTPKTPKTPRGKAKKDDKKEEEEEKTEDPKEEIVSRSGRKIRPKRYIDEQTEENATLPSPAPKKRRGSAQPEKSDKPDKPEKSDKEKDVKEKEVKEKSQEKNMKHFSTVPQVELEDLKEPFKSADAEKENILIAYLPSGQYCGIKLFQSRPASFKDEAARLQWEKQAASNAITLKHQLERGQITPQSVIGQLVLDLNLTDEEKASLDKERETEEKKSRVQFLKTEMKLIELDAKIKTCLCLEKADVDTCLKLLDELMELDIKPLMLLKHPCCVETVKRMRAYVGNAPRWQLSDQDALLFASRAHNVRKQADTLYKRLKELFTVSEGLAFWEYFSSRVQQFQQATASLSADQLLEMVHEPPELSQPSAVTMQAAIEQANKEEPPLEEDEPALKKKPNAKAKKAASTPAKQPAKRQSSRGNKQGDKDKEKEKEKENDSEKTREQNDKPQDEQPQEIQENDKQATDNDTTEQPTDKTDTDKPTEEPVTNNEQTKPEVNNERETEKMDTDTNEKEVNDKAEENEKQEEKKEDKQEEKKEKKTSKKQDSEKKSKKEEENGKDKNSPDKETSDSSSGRETRKEKKKEQEKEKQKEKEAEDKKEKEDEPRAKRSRAETKKTDPPPRSPAKRKSKA